jgi:hypothetical protein
VQALLLSLLALSAAAAAATAAAGGALILEAAFVCSFKLIMFREDEHIKVKLN